jgi:Domain of unknown function (DUF4411)
MYLLDANVFIDGKNRHYGFDIAPGFWDWILQSHAARRVFTIKAVSDEITSGGDDLAVWMRGQPASFKLTPSGADQGPLASLARWASTQTFTPGAQATFLGAADYFLVAQAATLGYTVVTQEISEPARRNRVKIPDACNAIGASWMTPFDMLRAEGVRLVI